MKKYGIYDYDFFPPGQEITSERNPIRKPVSFWYWLGLIIFVVRVFTI